MLLRLGPACRRLPRNAILNPIRTLASSTRPSAARNALRSLSLSHVGLAAGAALTTSLIVANARDVIYADVEEAGSPSQSNPSPAPLSSVIRSYVVYSLCSVPTLVDWSPTILSALFAVPGVRQIAEAVIRATFYDQFVGGDTAEDALPLLEQLRAENKGCLFAYSVEVDEEEAAGKAKITTADPVHKQIVAETLHCIDVAADFEDKHSSDGGRDLRGRKTWVAIKLTAMLPHAQTLINFSKHLISTRPAASPTVPFPGRPLASDFDVLAVRSASGGLLTDADIADLRELRDDLRAICQRAKERGIRIIVDAEHSWYQPAIDAFALSLQREFNRLPQRSSFGWFRSPQTPAPAVQPLVYQTYQAYLLRAPRYLEQSLDAARAEGYSLGVKLVRGAYHPHELTAHAAASSSIAALPISAHENVLSISPDLEPPVWSTKAETDTCYTACVTLLLTQVRADVKARRTEDPPSLGVLFGTHNWRSCDLILEQLATLGLAHHGEHGAMWLPEEVTERVAVGQLYGMSDALTQSLVDRTRSSSPFVIKYIPYGALSEVMPYLSRRAIENKSVLGNGGATDERRRAGGEIWKRIFG